MDWIHFILFAYILGTGKRKGEELCCCFLTFLSWFYFVFIFSLYLLPFLFFSFSFPLFIFFPSLSLLPLIPSSIPLLALLTCLSFSLYAFILLVSIIPKPPHVKSWLTGKDPDAGRDWGQEEKGMTEDEMAGWHHRLDGHGFE